MLVRVPFSYSATFIASGKRREETGNFWEWLEVDIPELSDDDAPVALRWQDEAPGGDERYKHILNWGLFPKDGKCESRWRDESHWMPVLVEDRWGTSADRLTAAALAEMCSKGDHYRNPLMKPFNGSNLFRAPDGRPFNPKTCRTVISSNREAEVELILAKASNLFIANGVVWKRTAEPVLFLKAYFDYGHSYQAAIKVLPVNSREITDPRAVYRADRFEEAAQAAVLDKNSNGDIELMNLHRSVTVLIPESVRYRDEEAAFEHAVREVLSHYGGQTLNELPRATALAWYELRDAYRTSGDDRHDKMEACLETLSETIVEESWKRTADRALERWRSRPISITDDEDCPSAPRP